jgi:1-phosphofructokinase family hexose kinase
MIVFGASHRNTDTMIVIIAPSLDDKRMYSIGQLHPGGVHRSRGVIRHASGKGANAARAVARSGGDVLLCAPAGAALRHLLEDQLASLGIRLMLTPTRARTRCCVTVLEDDGRATELVEEALPLETEEAVRFLSEAMQAVDAAHALLLAGSLPPGLPSDFHARCARRGAARGVPVVIDAQGMALLDALPASHAVVKINREEFEALRSLAGDPDRDDDTLAAYLRHLGASAVVVTDGGAPVRVWTDTGRTDIAVPGVRVVNPVGSGDAMSGGLAAALAAGASIGEAVRAGIALGSANARSLLPGEI